MSAELQAHLAVEDSDVYPRLLCSGDVATEGAARQLTEEFRDLTADWSMYLNEWTPDLIGADWGGFRHDTRRMMERLSERIRRENELLYPLALRGSLLPLRAG